MYTSKASGYIVSIKASWLKLDAFIVIKYLHIQIKHKNEHTIYGRGFIQIVVSTIINVTVFCNIYKYDIIQTIYPHLRIPCHIVY